MIEIRPIQPHQVAQAKRLMSEQSPLKPTEQPGFSRLETALNE
jgi:hypothetical protein